MARATAAASKVIAAARGWLGTPYHDQASVKGIGCDCLGLTRGVWRDLHGPEPVKVPPYTRDWGETGRREVLYEGARATGMVEVPLEDVRPGDVLIFRMFDGAVAKHCGIMAEDGRFIHAYERLGVIEEHFSDAWRRRLAFAFRYPRPKPRRKS